MNELHDVNEHLKKSIKRQLGSNEECSKLLNELLKENEQLQLQMLRLYNYFEDYFEDTMSPDSFSEMWDIVKESEKWEKR